MRAIARKRSRRFPTRWSKRFSYSAPRRNAAGGWTTMRGRESRRRRCSLRHSRRRRKSGARKYCARSNASRRHEKKAPRREGRGALVSADAREARARCTHFSIQSSSDVESAAVAERRRSAISAECAEQSAVAVATAVVVGRRFAESIKSTEQPAVAVAAAVVVVRWRPTVSTLAAQSEQSTSDRRPRRTAAMEGPLILTEQVISGGWMAGSTVALIGVQHARRSAASASTTVTTRATAVVRRRYVSRRTVVSAVAVIPVGVGIFPRAIFVPVMTSDRSVSGRHAGCMGIKVVVVVGSRRDRRREHRETNQHRHQTSFGIHCWVTSTGV